MESTSDYPLAWTVSRNVRTFLDDMAPASVGKRLKRLRESRDLTQDQLADLIGVKERTVSRWETGASRGLYDDDVLEQLAAALKIEPEDIIGPRAVPPAELHDLRAQLDRIETNQRLLLDFFDITADQHGRPEITYRDAYATILQEPSAPAETATPASTPRATS
jgi:transcriptional regulator with XRE-family HTH domain